MAQVNAKADLLNLRTLWAEQGRMEELLRSPFQGKPSSLLRGDDYFLPELGRAMRMLAHPFEARATEGDHGPPIDLTLTTTRAPVRGRAAGQGDRSPERRRRTDERAGCPAVPGVAQLRRADRRAQPSRRGVAGEPGAAPVRVPSRE